MKEQLLPLRILKRLALVHIAILALGLHASADLACCASLFHGALNGHDAVSAHLCVDGEEDVQGTAEASFTQWAKANGVFDELLSEGVLSDQGGSDQGGPVQDAPHACDCQDNAGSTHAALSPPLTFYLVLATEPERKLSARHDVPAAQFDGETFQARAPPFSHA